MAGGTCTISYSGTTIDLGIITSISRSYSKSVSTTPLVSLPMEQAFPLESSSQMTLSISFSRESDSNASWYNSLTQAMNRWQCKTDGFTLTYTADSDNPYVPSMTVNGYIKSLTRSYSSEGPRLITGSIEFHVGTMYCSTSTTPYGADGRAQSDFAIFIYDNDDNPCCILGTSDDGSEINCVSSYTLYGGLEQPFEYIQIKIPKKKLAQVAPTLTEEYGIVAGKTTLQLYAVGTCNMTVTKCKLSGNTYTITAYSNAEKIRGYTLSGGARYTPSFWIRYILTSGQFGVTYTEGSTLIMHFNDDISTTIQFSEGTNVWYILQVCAMLLGAKVFFSGNNAYVVDYRLADGGSVISDVGTIDLYGSSEYEAMVTDTVDLGDEGTDTIINKQIIKYSTSISEDGSVTSTDVQSVTCSDDASISTFGEMSGNAITIAEMFSATVEVTSSDEEDEEEDTSAEDAASELLNLAETWGNNYVSYRSEPQQSISFSLKEMVEYNGEPYWREYFSPCSRATSIIDSVDEVTVTNNSVVDSSRSPVYQRLLLSNYERTYPEGITTYTWGVMQTVDLSTSTSTILGTINNS